MFGRVESIRISARWKWLWLLVIWVGVCANGWAGNFWRGPSFALPRSGFGFHSDVSANLPSVEQIYSHAIDLEQQGCETCVDHYFELAVMTASHQNHPDLRDRVRRLHESSLQKLVVTGQHFGRFDARCGLTVVRDGGSQWIPINHFGFAWCPDDFCELAPVGDYHIKSLSHYYRQSGVGVPLVVTSYRRPGQAFRPVTNVFAATLRMVVPSGDAPRLEIHDPFNVNAVLVDQVPCPIAKDLTAPIAYRIYSRPTNVLDAFIRPNSVSRDTGNSQGTLFTLEPYQRGKIPIVLIHGLLSDPFTWAEMVNELASRPEFVQQFQIWVFEYPTGRPFLTSASQLRSQLEAACRTFDPFGVDPQLSNIILAGHSMGGLVAKLQITTSGDQLWQSVANRPLDQVVVQEELRQRLLNSFFFYPSPRITRVVYLATPHRGSAIASRLIGRISASLVEEPVEQVQAYETLIASNPGVFSREFTRGVPTSIDLLEPQSEVLQAVDQLPTRCEVAIHSIIGDLGVTLTLGRSDGIVPVKNAKDRRAMTERIVHATHTGVKEHPDAILEFREILELHLKGVNGY